MTAAIDYGTSLLALFQTIGLKEIIIILVVALLLFGGRKIPELAKGLARGLKSFKREMRDVGGELDDIDDAAKTPTESLPKEVESSSVDPVDEPDTTEAEQKKDADQS